jgi:hypothetical protein
VRHYPSNRSGGAASHSGWRTSALITIWATLKLPQCSRLIEVQESVRWAALDDWMSWSDGCYLGAYSEDSQQSCERIEPDVHLIKHVEQVTYSALEGPTWRFARIPSIGGHGRRRNPCISDLAITALAVIWQPKQSEEGRGRPVAILPALTGGSTNRPHRLPNRCSAKFGETAITSET